MINNSHLLQFKKAIDHIHPIGNECFTELKAIINFRKLEKDEYFSRAGDYNKEFAFVLDGILRIFYLSENGQEHNKHFLVKNDFITASIKSDQKSITNIQVLAPTTLASLDYSSFVSLVKKYSQLSLFIQKLTERYLEKKQEREIQLLSQKTSDIYLVFLKNYPRLINDIPLYHIASYLGITPTQLSRIRGKIKVMAKYQHM